MIINEPICIAGGALTAAFFFLVNLSRFQIWLGDKIDKWRADRSKK
jgi:hypothetical protein